VRISSILFITRRSTQSKSHGRYDMLNRGEALVSSRVQVYNGCIEVRSDTGRGPTAKVRVKTCHPRWKYTGTFAYRGAVFVVPSRYDRASDLLGAKVLIIPVLYLQGSMLTLRKGGSWKGLVPLGAEEVPFENGGVEPSGVVELAPKNNGCLHNHV